jgi:hypothetical protein
MTQYRYLFADILTNQITAELNLTNVNFTQQLNAAGTFTGQILLSGLTPASNATNATIPGRSALYIERQISSGNRQLVWGGVVWNREYSSATQSLTLTAREFESYFERRRITATTSFTNTDQLVVARSLMNTAQAATNGNVGVLVGTETSGVNISKTYYNYELKSVYSALLDLSRSQNGFDFNILVAYDGSGNITKTLKLNYPLSGIRYSSTSVDVPMFELPAGNIVEYTYPEDGSIAANKVYVMGGGSSDAKQILTSTDTNKLTEGWPLLEDSANYSDITDATLLQKLADGQVAAVAYPPTTLKVVAPPYIAPEYGTYSIGDDARIRINDSRFPNGIDAVYRIVGLTVTPGESGPERVTLTLTLPTS